MLERRQRLSDVDYCLSADHMYERWSGDRERAHPEVVIFGERVLKAAASMYIPLHIRAIFDCTVEIVHSQFLESLDVMDWWVIGHLGKEIAHRSGIHVEWGGDTVGRGMLAAGPAWWEVDAAETEEYVDTSGCRKAVWVPRRNGVE